MARLRPSLWLLPLAAALLAAAPPPKPPAKASTTAAPEVPSMPSAPQSGPATIGATRTVPADQARKIQKCRQAPATPGCPKP